MTVGNLDKISNFLFWQFTTCRKYDIMILLKHTAFTLRRKIKMKKMKYSSKILDKLHKEFLENPDDVFAKSKFFIYKAMWKNERKDLELKWLKDQRRKI